MLTMTLDQPNLYKSSSSAASGGGKQELTCIAIAPNLTKQGLSSFPCYVLVCRHLLLFILAMLAAPPA